MQSLILTTCRGDAHPTLRQDWWKWDNPPLEAFTGWLGQEPVGIARTFDVRLSMPGITLECIGIGGVFVNDQHRGQGFAKQIICGLTMRAGSRGLPFVLRARDGRLYEAIGFQKIGQDGDQGLYCVSPGYMTIKSHPSWQVNRAF